MQILEHTPYVVEPECFCGWIDQMLPVAVDGDSHYAPEVIDAVGVEKRHLPPFGLWRKGSHEYESCALGNKRFPGVLFYGE